MVLKDIWEKGTFSLREKVQVLYGVIFYDFFGENLTISSKSFP